MFRLALIATLLTAGLTAGCVTTADAERQGARDAAEIARALDGLTPGETRSCVPRERVTQSRNFRGTILFVEGRDSVYRNDVVGGCAGLGRDDLIVIKSLSGQYCSGDIVETRARIGGTLTGSCALGQFVPYRK